MASSSVAMSPTARQDWRKMNKQALRDALASRGLDTNGLRPSLIQRLESSVKAGAEVLATSAADESSKSTSEMQEKTDFIQTKPHAVAATRAPNRDKTSALISISQEKKSTQEVSNAKAHAPKRDFGPVKTVDGNGKSAPNVPNTTCLSDLEKKRWRAERFGVGLQVSEQEKLALRAERFAGVDGKKSSSAREPESERRKHRAARFGIVDEESRKKARQERFAIPLKQENSNETDKWIARAARFGATIDHYGKMDKE